MRRVLLLSVFAMLPFTSSRLAQAPRVGIANFGINSDTDVCVAYDFWGDVDSVHIIAALVTRRGDPRHPTRPSDALYLSTARDSAAQEAQRLGRSFCGTVGKAIDASMSTDHLRRQAFVHGQQFSVPTGDSAVLIVIDSVDTRPKLSAHRIASPVDAPRSTSTTSAKQEHDRSAWRQQLNMAWLHRMLREPSVFAFTRLHTGRLELREAAVGCWSLRDSTAQIAQGRLYWSPANTRLSNTLDSSRWSDGFPSSRDAWRIDSLGRDQSARDDPNKRGWGVWSADALSDSIRIGFSSGFSGTWFVLALPNGTRPDTLYGRAFEHWDYQPITERGRASAVRVRCPNAKIP